MDDSDHGGLTEKIISPVTVSSTILSRCQTLHRAVQIDIVPSSFLITSEVDKCLRLCAKLISNLLSRTYPGLPVSVTYLQGNIQVLKNERNDADIISSQILSNPLWWTCLLLIEDNEWGDNSFKEASEKKTLFARSWCSLLKLKRAFDNFRSPFADISSLDLGLCPSESQNFTEIHALSDQTSGVWPINMRLGVPTVSPKKDFFLATPPSLAWALTVTIEFYRFLVEKERSVENNSNLTSETMGVLENWADFITYGTLLKSKTENQSHTAENWLNDMVKDRVASLPAPFTIVVKYDIAEDDVAEADDIFNQLEKAWRRAVHKLTSSGDAIVLRDIDINDMEETVVEEIVNRCKSYLGHDISAASSTA